MRLPCSGSAPALPPIPMLLAMPAIPSRVMSFTMPSMLFFSFIFTVACMNCISTLPASSFFMMSPILSLTEKYPSRTTMVSTSL